ncbi:MAG: V-type ATP synthase subunit D [Gammaproteobacteria bacterium]
MPDITPTRSAFLALREEREGMREGYRFLDEKRLVLAAEMLAELKRYETALGRFHTAWAEAVRGLQGAVARHGLEGLFLYPPRPVGFSFAADQYSVLGVPMLKLAIEPCGEEAAPELPVNASPEAEHCRALFAQLLPEAARLAVMAGNLERLRAEYQRTSRRARALEDVLLPEIAQNLDFLETALEELDKEEALRVRYSRAGGGSTPMP